MDSINEHYEQELGKLTGALHLSLPSSKLGVLDDSLIRYQADAVVVVVIPFAAISAVELKIAPNRKVFVLGWFLILFGVFCVCLPFLPAEKWLLGSPLFLMGVAMLIANKQTQIKVQTNQGTIFLDVEDPDDEALLFVASLRHLCKQAGQLNHATPPVLTIRKE